MTRAARIRFGRLSELGCILCRHIGHPGTPAEIHHLRDGHGMGQRAPDDLTIPLCPFHHRGPGGFHGLGKRRFEALYELTERQLLEMTNELLNPQTSRARAFAYAPEA